MRLLKKRTGKRLFTGILVSVLTLSATFGSGYIAQAYDDMKQTEDGWVYRMVDADRQIMIHDYKGTETDVYIPERIDGLLVTTVDATDFEDTEIVVLHIPKTVEYIFSECFADDDAMLKIKTLEQIIVDEENQYYKSINGVLYSKNEKTLVRVPMQRTGAYVVPDTVETIEWSAFDYTGITSIKIGKRVKRCGIGFETCDNLKKISVAKGNRYYSAKAGVLYNKKKTKIFGCVVTKKGYYKMPSTVKELEYGAFRNCKKLTKVKLSDNIKFFSHDIFMGCTRLSKVVFGKRTQKIGSNSFEDTAVKKLIIPKNVKEIHYEAFIRAFELKTVVIKGTRTDIREAIDPIQSITYCVPKKALKWYKKQLKNVDMGDNKLIGI